jgi:orotate phosphoribosyltransferase
MDLATARAFGRSLARPPAHLAGSMGPASWQYVPVDRDKLASLLHAACYLEGRFLLRSGQVADFYFDKYMFESDPTLLRAVAEQAAPLIPAGTDVLAGLELGGVPIATALSLLTGLPQVLVRKQAKQYGTAKLAEGPDVAGKRLLVVEDVVTTGGQVVLSAQELRRSGAAVDDVLCVIDRRPRAPSGAGGAAGHPGGGGRDAGGAGGGAYEGAGIAGGFLGRASGVTDMNRGGTSRAGEGDRDPRSLHLCKEHGAANRPGTRPNRQDRLSEAGLNLISLFTSEELRGTQGH